MSWRGLGHEWDGILAGLALVALVLALVIAREWWALVLLAGLALGLVATVWL